MRRCLSSTCGRSQTRCRRWQCRSMKRRCVSCRPRRCTLSRGMELLPLYGALFLVGQNMGLHPLSGALSRQGGVTPAGHDGQAAQRRGLPQHGVGPAVRRALPRRGGAAPAGHDRQAAQRRGFPGHGVAPAVHRALPRRGKAAPDSRALRTMAAAVRACGARAVVCPRPEAPRAMELAALAA